MASKTSKYDFKVKPESNLNNFQEALETLLYVPDPRVRRKIIEEIVVHYQKKINAQDYPVSLFIAYQQGIPVGMVACQIDPEYRTYSRKATTFSWLLCENFEICELLMEQVEKFARTHKKRKIRGPINYPKIVGGIGIQTEGHSAPIMNGINFNHPNSQILSHLKVLGYELESKYSCVLVISKNWEKGNTLDSDYFIRYLSLSKMRQMKGEIMELATNSFYSILADAPGGESRFEEMMRSYELVYDTPLNQELSKSIRDNYSNIGCFSDAWNSCDFEDIVFWAPCAFKRDNNQLVGIIMSLPNLYQFWGGDPLDIANVDTVMIHKKHSGKGIFSTLNNIGRLTVEMYGIIKAEGTSIWANNERAIQTIFPHTKPLRTHVVLQKRVKSTR